MHFRWHFIALLAVPLLTAFGTPLASAQDDEDELAPGLLATYTASGKSVQRIDRDLSFVWEGASPDPQLPAGEFSAAWKSLLLLQQEGAHTWHVYLQGEAEILVDGKTVLAADRPEPAWVSGSPVTLGFGEVEFEVRFRKTAPQARLQVFWSSDGFRLEPLPWQFLFLKRRQPELEAYERGMVLFDSLRCARCHVRDDLPVPPAAPALVHAAATYSLEELAAKIRNPSQGQPGSRMPQFGFSEDESRAMAAWLRNQSKPVGLLTPGTPKDEVNEARQGEILFRSIGCLACHRLGDAGQADPYGGGDLSNVGGRRSRAWLETWLADPAKLNPDYRMPVFKLSSQERGQLSLFLSGIGQPQQAARIEAQAIANVDEPLLKEGERLIRSARCAACHQIPGIKPDTQGIPNLSGDRVDWSRSCLSDRPDPAKHQPGYRAVDAAALQRYGATLQQLQHRQSDYAQGARILEQRNCLGCHERAHRKGIVPIAGQMARIDAALDGKSQGLTPPALNAVGDKFELAALMKGVGGDLPVRMPWLSVRMPRFQHNEQDRAALAAYFVAHDRIPDGAPDTAGAALLANREQQTETARTDTLLAGHTLVGPKGFSCIACHQMGEYIPKNVALGTRGSDLMFLAQRMRLPYYLRWTLSPARIVPGMEMPSYKRAAPGLLGGDVEAQLLATWDALNDPDFTVPTDLAAVEQFLTVKPDEPARIVRDVFTIPEGDGTGTVARAFAIGFHNGHNVLLDVGNFSLRQWTFGDFARQRAQGKSWYWDMAGVPVVPAFEGKPGLSLLIDGQELVPKFSQGTCGRLTSYRTLGQGVELVYDLDFAHADKTSSITVHDVIEPIIENVQTQRRTGWKRTLTATRLPALGQLCLSVPAWQKGLGQPAISIEQGTARDMGTRVEAVRLADGARKICVVFGTDLAAAPLDIKSDPQHPSAAAVITSVPGFEGVRLPLDGKIMPTALAWTADGILAFTSLKGHVYLAHDRDGDGLEETLTLFEEGLAAPYGLIADGPDLIVAHKPELLRLSDTDGDGRCDTRTVIASGWGYTDNYHDWTCGIVRDRAGNFYVGLGSDYAQPKRPKEHSLWRGKVLKIDPQGAITPVGHAFRYPTGLAIDSQDRIFVSDNQGVQNTFNEINWLQPGKHYGVPARWEEDPKAPAEPPAIQIPHPWTRSVNGLFFVTANAGVPELLHHGIGCEYDSRFLMRYTLQQVGNTIQGACYSFSQPNAGSGDGNFQGPLVGGVSPRGEIYIGSIHDSGWLGGQNTGEIVRLKPLLNRPNGIRELRAHHDGFELEFFAPVNPQAAMQAANYSISGYTRVWQGSYATPDSGRHQLAIKSASISGNHRTVRLTTDKLRIGYVYEVSCGNIGTGDESLFPSSGHYTLNVLPE